MTLTLLIDLDDTLLGNQMDTFIPAYLGALGKYLSNHVPPEQMVTAMMAATGQMFQNNRFDRTLKQTFDPAFYPPLGLIEPQVRPLLECFYAEVFPSLRSITQPRQEALDLVNDAFERGYRVGIATNPLFPRTAIVQRLEWAGFRLQYYPFALISSYETFHFAKPNPAYFAEFMSRMGWPRGPVVMVGNDYEHDVLGAQSLGIPTFWVTNGQPLPKSDIKPAAMGHLNELMGWLDINDDEDLRPNYETSVATTAMLRGIPAGIDHLTKNLPAAGWDQAPEADEWNLTQIACHLRDVEREVNLPRLQSVATGSNPFIAGIDTDAWSDERQYAAQDGPQAILDFFTARMELLALLEGLTSEGWKHPARHAIFGPTTLMELAGFIASHDRLHLRQIYATLKA